jgi:hypothetical protein
MAEPGTGRGKAIGLIFPPGRIDFRRCRTKPGFKPKGKRNIQGVCNTTPGSAMLLKVLGGTSAERRCTGGLSRSGASPYQCIEDENDDDD